jgi:hypothetical protein
MNQYWPFFLTAFFPCFIVVVGMWMNSTRFNSIERQLDHLIDLHINHAERIAWLESKAEKN